MCILIKFQWCAGRQSFFQNFLRQDRKSSWIPSVWGDEWLYRTSTNKNLMVFPLLIKSRSHGGAFAFYRNSDSDRCQWHSSRFSGRDVMSPSAVLKGGRGTRTPPSRARQYWATDYQSLLLLGPAYGRSSRTLLRPVPLLRIERELHVSLWRSEASLCDITDSRPLSTTVHWSKG